MERGKQTCKILKEIRQQIAEANDIEYVTTECGHKGDCPGTCPKCEAEVRYLEQQLRTRTLAGRAVTLVGISAAVLATLMSLPAAAQIQQDSKELSSENIPVPTDTIIIKGTVLSGDTLSDGTISKEPIVGATIINRRLGKVTVADWNGGFSILSSVGDSLEVKSIGYETQTIVVTEGMENATITLALEHVLLGEMVVTETIPVIKREEMHYIDLNVIDEHGNPIDRGDIYVERFWIDSDGKANSRPVSMEYFDEKHPCRIYWDYNYGLTDENGKTLKKAILSIEAEGYDDPVLINVRYPKRNSRKTIKFDHKKLK